MKKRSASENTSNKFNFSNRVLYSLITLGILAVLAVGVYAAASGTAPNPGHLISELEICNANGEILQSDGSVWSCVDGSSLASIGDVHNNKWCKGDNTGVIQCTENKPGLWEKDNGDLYYVDGNVGIGTNDPSASLDIGGGTPDQIDGVNDLLVAGDVEIDGALYSPEHYYYSDRALKENIQPLQNPLNAVEALEGVSFNWKENGEASIGFIAQDVEKVLPELVSGEEGHKSVAYANIVAVLTEAVKEQQKQIEELQREIEELKDN